MGVVGTDDAGSHDRVNALLDERSRTCDAEPCIRYSRGDKSDEKRGEDFGEHVEPWGVKNRNSRCPAL